MASASSAASLRFMIGGGGSFASAAWGWGDGMAADTRDGFGDAVLPPPCKAMMLPPTINTKRTTPPPSNHRMVRRSWRPERLAWGVACSHEGPSDSLDFEEDVRRFRTLRLLRPCPVPPIEGASAAGLSEPSVADDPDVDSFRDPTHSDGVGSPGAGILNRRRQLWHTKPRPS
ncbi:MAG: hypothetical protein WCP45_01400 [Verrucomicrobiota bacterium]